jgi:acyl carrier protein
MSDDVSDRVISLVAEKCRVPVASVAASATFVEDLGIDSLDAVDLLIAIEHEFDLDVPDEDAAEVTTVGQTITYVRDALRERAHRKESRAAGLSSSLR